VDPLWGEIDVLGVSVSLVSKSSSLLRNGCYLSKGAKFCFLKNGGRQEVRSARRRGERDRSVESLVLADRLGKEEIEEGQALAKVG
jgi:hypothetical protein